MHVLTWLFVMVVFVMAGLQMLLCVCFVNLRACGVVFGCRRLCRDTDDVRHVFLNCFQTVQAHIEHNIATIKKQLGRQTLCWISLTGDAKATPAAYSRSLLQHTG